MLSDHAVKKLIYAVSRNHRTGMALIKPLLANGCRRDPACVLIEAVRGTLSKADVLAINAWAEAVGNLLCMPGRVVSHA